MRVIVAAICLILTCNCLVAHPRGGGGSPPTATEIPDSLFEQAIACIKRFEGWHGKHLPYVGWGHKLLPGETFRPDMSKAQADSLLRADLRKLCRMCSRFGKDALLVATLSYNVGYFRLVGYGKIPKSWKPGTGTFTTSMSHSGATRGKWYRALNGEEKWNICYCLRSKKEEGESFGIRPPGSPSFVISMESIRSAYRYGVHDFRFFWQA